MGQFFILRSRVQQEYNGFLVNALNRIFKSNLSVNTFKWLPTKMELSCVRNIIPRSRKRLWNGYPVLNQELQNHDPFGRHIPVYVMYRSTPPPPGCHPRSGSCFSHGAWSEMTQLSPYYYYPPLYYTYIKSRRVVGDRKDGNRHFTGTRILFNNLSARFIHYIHGFLICNY